MLDASSYACVVMPSTTPLTSPYGPDISSYFLRHGSMVIAVRSLRLVRTCRLLVRRRGHFGSPILRTRHGAESIAIIHPAPRNAPQTLHITAQGSLPYARHVSKEIAIF